MTGGTEGQSAVTRFLRGGNATVDAVGAANLLARVEERLFNRAWKELRLSRYIVLHRLGRGAFGSVYAAYDPELDRRVAIKLLSSQERAPAVAESGPVASPDSSMTEVVAPEPEKRPDSLGSGRERLLREAQALARFVHPNVVAVYDVGTYALDADAPLGDSGVPLHGVFIVMELIDGHRFDDWLDAKPRTWPEVLGRMIEAGRGLAAAHRNGLVHRDIKPANVLVGRDGKAKVVDFGLARAPGARLDELGEPDASASSTGGVSAEMRRDALSKTLTQTGAVLGTPLFMAPEQHMGVPADARADQFSFCLTLYQALYGRFPYETTDLKGLVRSKRSDAVRQPPTRPRVPRWLFAVIRRGLSADPNSRYPSMDALLSALERRPRVQRGAFAAASGLVASGFLLALWPAASSDPCDGFERELQGTWDATQRAEIAAAFEATHLPYAKRSAQRLDHELDEFARAWVDARAAVCRDDPGSTGITGERMLCLERSRYQLGGVVRLLARADAQIVQAGPLLVADLGSPATCVLTQDVGEAPSPADPDAALAAEEWLAQAEVFSRANRADEALELVARAMGQAERLDSSRLLSRGHRVRARVLLERGDAAQARTAAASAIEHGEGARDREAVFEAAAMMIEVLIDAGEYDEAELIASIFEPRLRSTPAGPDVEATLRHAIAVLRVRQGRYETAVSELERALRLTEELHGVEHPFSGRLFNVLGSARSQDARYGEALDAYGRALAVFSASLGDEHPEVGKVLNNIANVHMAVGDFERAEQHLRRAIAIWERSVSTEHPVVATGYANLARVADRQGRRTEALAHFDRALAIQRAALGDEHPSTLSTLEAKAIALAAIGRNAEAIPMLERVLQLTRARLGKDHPDTIDTMVTVGSSLVSEHQIERAEPLLREAVGEAERRFGSDHPRLGRGLLALARVEMELGRRQSAQRRRERVVELLSRTQSAHHPGLAQVRLELGETLLEEGDYEAARENLELAIEAIGTEFGPKHGRLAWPLSLLGLAHLHLGDPSRARAELERALALTQTYEGPPLQPAAIRFGLARATLDVNPALARQIARRALDEARVTLPEHALVAEIETWLGAQASH